MAAISYLPWANSARNSCRAGWIATSGGMLVRAVDTAGLFDLVLLRDCDCAKVVVGFKAEPNIRTRARKTVKSFVEANLESIPTSERRATRTKKGVYC